jgi:circadian clock protein KaiB
MLDSSPPSPATPSPFKGIALFTPGGDLVYSIDRQKQKHWHLQLCVLLQEQLGLSEPPHFLVPCYTATVDRWWNSTTQQLETIAEASPLVMRYEALLNAVFRLGDWQWQRVAHREECHPLILQDYRRQFPQLWQSHNLVFQLQSPDTEGTEPSSTLTWQLGEPDLVPQSYVLRLFVSGHSSATEQVLHKVHQLLERSLQQAYTLKVIDIHKRPDLAEADQISATPTLLKVYPPPMRRIVGDLEQIDLNFLDL